MKQKYVILKNENDNELIIREFAELDKETMSLLCEASYSYDTLEKAAAEGKDTLVAALRTPNMYPIGHYVETIAEAVQTLLTPDSEPSAELLFDDIKLVESEKKEAAQEEEIEADDTEIDEILSEDVDDDIDDKLEIKNIKTSIRVADDESTGTDETSA
jgi:hypothetical protein